MNRKTTNILAYITVIGLILAVVLGDRENCKFHINQSIVIWLFSLLTAVPGVGKIWGIFMFVCWLIGLIGAVQDKETLIPLLGNIVIYH